MPGKSQNLDSWFYKARVEAGFPNAASLAQQVDVPKSTVYGWERGSADRGPSSPPWRLMPQLGAILNVTLAELVVALWKEAVGDPCPCRCGGKKVFPEQFPEARKLRIELPCVECGKKRTYPQWKQDHHRKRCNDCSKSGERTEYVDAKCRGYSDHNATRWACRQETKRRRLSYFKARSFFDPSTNPPTYKCNRCLSTERLNAALEEKLREIEAKQNFGGKKYLVKIKARAYRLELLRKHRHQLKWGRLRFSPEEQERGRRQFAENAATGKEYPEMTKANLRRHWLRGSIPKRMEVGICIRCENFIPSMNSPDPHFHGKCHNQWERTPEGRCYQSLKVHGQEASLPRPECPVDVNKDVLVAIYSWTVAFVAAGKSFRQIGKENKMDHKTAKKHVFWLLGKTPDPSLVAACFRPTMRLFQAAYRSLQLENSPPVSEAAPSYPTN